jgi:uncharacterized membrane protein (DUF485 family)
MKKRGSVKRNFSQVLLRKFELLSVLLFIFALFLLDVNLNLIASYDLSMNVPLFNGIVIPASSMFWLGFIVMSVCLFIVCIRSFHRRKNFRGFDILFSLTGIIGWGIILSGGLLIFFGGDDFIIPFFNMLISRIDYYHIGIGLEVISIIYFALVNDGN